MRYGFDNFKLKRRSALVYPKNYKNNLLPLNLSGFRLDHSCTMAQMNITDDIFEAIDNLQGTALILLDFKKAFDSIKHNILLNILSSFGVSDLPCC